MYGQIDRVVWNASVGSFCSPAPANQPAPHLPIDSPHGKQRPEPGFSAKCGKLKLSCFLSVLCVSLDVGQHFNFPE